MSNSGQFILTAVDGTVTAHRRATGEVAWKHRVPEGKADHRHVTRIHADEHRVVMVAARMNESGMFATADSTAYVCCLEYATGERVWEHPIKVGQNIAHFTATLLVEDGQVFVAHGESLLAFALETGELMWRRQVDRVSGRFPVSVSLAVPGHAQQGDAR